MRNHSTRREVLRAVAILCGARSVYGQDEPVFSTDVKVVNVLATVRSKTGSLVADLSKDDFLLFEDGRPQTIRYFARESNLPLTLGLMIDTSGSQRRVLDAERGACLRFLDQVVRENKDRVFIMQFDSAVRMRQALTSSVGKLDEALAYGIRRPCGSCRSSTAAALCSTMPWPERPTKSCASRPAGKR